MAKRFEDTKGEILLIYYSINYVGSVYAWRQVKNKINVVYTKCMLQPAHGILTLISVNHTLKLTGPL